MITNRQNNKIQLALRIFVGPNRILVAHVDPNRSRTEILKTELNRTAPESAFKNSVEPNQTRIEKFRFVSVSGAHHKSLQICINKFHTKSRSVD